MDSLVIPQLPNTIPYEMLLISLCTDVPSSKKMGEGGAVSVHMLLLIKGLVTLERVYCNCQNCRMIS